MERKTKSFNYAPERIWAAVKPHLKIVFEGLATLAALAGLFILISQLAQLREQTKLNREALTSVQRAFVHVKLTPPETIVVDPPYAPKYKVFAEWKNSGNTSPEDLRVKLFCRKVSAPLQRPQDSAEYETKKWLRQC